MKNSFAFKNVSKKIPPESSTEMVSSRSYWLNEVSHYHRSQSEWGKQMHLKPARLHLARQKEQFGEGSSLFNRA